MVSVQDVLDFWFGPEDGSEFGEFRTAWFTKNPEFDQAIADRFGAAMTAAGAGELDGWADHPKGVLALIILFDQFSRNVHRDTPGAFATDPQALVLAKQARARGFDQDLPEIQRTFVYMPYMHSEDLADQEESVRIFDALSNEGSADYAIQHRDIIARFGRFPHRNEILGRATTNEETEFLTQPGSSF